MNASFRTTLFPAVTNFVVFNLLKEKPFTLENCKKLFALNTRNNTDHQIVTIPLDWLTGPLWPEHLLKVVHKKDLKPAIVLQRALDIFKNYLPDNFEVYSKEVPVSQCRIRPPSTDPDSQSEKDELWNYENPLFATKTRTSLYIRKKI